MTSPRFTYNFEWDSEKARSNAAKHGIAFALAASVFRDPLAISLYDEEHGAAEDRWVMLGRVENGILSVVIHTFEDVAPGSATIRIISARKATRREIRDYESAPR